jgi:hypothetical protein
MTWRVALLLILWGSALAQTPVWSTVCGSPSDHGFSTSPVTQAAGPPYVRIGTFSYTVLVPDGQYLVLLSFIDPYRTAANQRIFDVTVNGLKVLAGFDIVGSVGQNQPVAKSFPVTATGATGIQIAYTPVASNTYTGCSSIPCGALCSGITVFLATPAPAGSFVLTGPPAVALSGLASAMPTICPTNAALTFYAATDTAALYYCVPPGKWQKLALAAGSLVGAVQPNGSCGIAPVPIANTQGLAWHDGGCWLP